MPRREKLETTGQDDVSSEEPLNSSDLKVPGRNAPAESGVGRSEHRRPRETVEELPETLGGGAACNHAKKIELNLSIQNANCACEGHVTRAIKRQRHDSASRIRAWQLVSSTDHGTTSCQSSTLGIVLSSNYVCFADNSCSEIGSSSVAAVGMLITGRIVATCMDSFQTVDAISTHFDVAAFSDMILQACADCHRDDTNDVSEENLARNFVSKVQVCGGLSCPTFESIFDRICSVCFDHQLEDSRRALFLQALRCVCSFKSFQSRFVCGRGPLALISLLHSCQSCLCADLALNCITAIMSNKTNAATMFCPGLVEALLCLVDTHSSSASKAFAIFELWLQSKRGKNCLLDGSLLARLADQMLSFQDIPAVVSSIKLLRCIAATESAAVAPFVESKQFCALFLHFCSKANSVISENDKNSENVLFSFWKGLGLLLRHKPAAVESASLREAFCDTLIQLVQQYNCSAGAHILCAQSFSMIAQMCPASIFLEQQECDILSKMSVSRNEQVKKASLKLIEDIVAAAEPSRGAIYICSRFTSSLVESLIGLRIMASYSTFSAFKNLARIGSELGVCVCPARVNLRLVKDTLSRKRMLDQWAPVVAAEAGDDACPLCMETMGMNQSIRQIRCPGRHKYCAECIESWLVYKQHDNCPVCRHDCAHDDSSDD